MSLTSTGGGGCMTLNRSIHQQNQNKRTPTYPWSIPQASPPPPKRNEFLKINCCFRVWGMFPMICWKIGRREKNGAITPIIMGFFHPSYPGPQKYLRFFFDSVTPTGCKSSPLSGFITTRVMNSMPHPSETDLKKNAQNFS